MKCKIASPKLIAAKKQNQLPFFFLCCQTFADLCKCLMSELIETDLCSLMLYEKSFTKLLPYEDARLKVKQTSTQD